MSVVSASSLPKPTTELESRMLTVLEARRIRFGTGHAQWDWAQLMDTAAMGEQYAPSACSDFFRLVLMDQREGERVFLLLEPFMKLSKKSEQRLRDFYNSVRLPAGVPAS